MPACLPVARPLVTIAGMGSPAAWFSGAATRPLVATLAALIACATAMAEQDAVAACREAATDAARIACLENALRRQDDAGETGAEAPPATEPDVSGPAASEDPEPVAAPAPEPAAVETPPAPAAGDLGAEQVRARNESREERDARLESASGLPVASYRTVPYRRLQVELENGQIWRQVKGDTQRIRVDLERNQTVDIDETGLGGYRLRLNEIRRIIAVERVR